MFRYKDYASCIKLEMPGICRKVDEVLSRAAHVSHDGDPAALEALLSEVFSEPLDRNTGDTIMNRYKNQYEDCTSDKKLINVVMSEACGMDAWIYNKVRSRWAPNMKLQTASMLFAEVQERYRELLIGYF